MDLNNCNRVLIIGGAGFIGRSVVSAFLDRGCEVSVLDMAQGSQRKVDWIIGSVFDLSLVASAASGCDAVVYLANYSLPGSSHADLSAEVEAHVLSTVRAAEICSNVGVKKFLFSSSGGTVYGYSPRPGVGLRETDRTRPLNAYGVSKLSIEHYLRMIADSTGMETVSLRIANPYGEGQRATRGQGIVAAAMQHAFKGTVMTIWGDGSAERDFLHVSDVASAFVAGAEYRGALRTFNIGSGRSFALRDLLEAIETVSGRKLITRYEKDREIDVQRNCLDIGRARAELDWTPQVSLDDGLRRTAEWWETQVGLND